MAAAIKPLPNQRPPAGLEERFAAHMAVEAGCATELLVPPAKECPRPVHAAYALAAWHPITLLFVVVILAMIVHLAFQPKD
ncbi:hypothetical protein HY734_02725 [Candidatus Uhrbacteria bacterium]|nr:hypothetical protein [Candidatus Uhrbacteria bacterium]